MQEKTRIKLLLPFPFLSLYEGRNIIFYWDGYFANIGLFYHENVKKYAKNVTDDLLHQAELYVFAYNYYLNVNKYIDEK